MTSTTTNPMTRPRDDRQLAGVAAAIAHRLDLDPVVVRLAFAVGALYGGLGIVVYAIAWAAVPVEGAPDRPARRWPMFVVVVLGALVLGDSLTWLRWAAGLTW